MYRLYHFEIRSVFPTFIVFAFGYLGFGIMAAAVACNGGLTTEDVGGTFRSSLDSGDIGLVCTGVDLFIVKYRPVTRELTSNNITTITNI